jgi:hypothetical protein
VSGYGYVLFYTSAAAFRAEALVQGLGRDAARSHGGPGSPCGNDTPGGEPTTLFALARLVPTPRELSSDCGVALRFPPGIEGAMGALLEGSSLPYERIVASSR